MHDLLASRAEQRPDLAVRKALARGAALPGEREVLARAERWRPWRAYATLALWNHEAGRAHAPGRAAATKRRKETP